MISSNYKIIKNLVEKHAKIKDLSIKGNKKHLALSRCVYYRICKYIKEETTAIQKQQKR